LIVYYFFGISFTLLISVILLLRDNVSFDLCLVVSALLWEWAEEEEVEEELEVEVEDEEERGGGVHGLKRIRWMSKEEKWEGRKDGARGRRPAAGCLCGDERGEVMTVPTTYPFKSAQVEGNFIVTFSILSQR